MKPYHVNVEETEAMTELLSELRLPPDGRDWFEFGYQSIRGEEISHISSSSYCLFIRFLVVIDVIISPVKSHFLSSCHDLLRAAGGCSL